MTPAERKQLEAKRDELIKSLFFQGYKTEQLSVIFNIHPESITKTISGLILGVKKVSVQFDGFGNKTISESGVKTGRIKITSTVGSEITAQRAKKKEQFPEWMKGEIK